MSRSRCRQPAVVADRHGVDCRLASEFLDALGGSGSTQPLPDPDAGRLVAICWALALYSSTPSNCYTLSVGWGKRQRGAWL